MSDATILFFNVYLYSPIANGQWSTIVVTTVLMKLGNHDWLAANNAADL